MKRKLLWTSLLACLLLALLCCAAESGDFTIDENGVLTKYTGSDAVVTVPDGVTAIGKEAFYAKSAITEIHLPTGITSIGDSAFRSCTGLTEIVVPDSVETIGDDAFYDCSSLASLRLSQGLKTLGTNVFLRCNSLTEVEIPAGVESVGNYIASNTLRLRCAVGSSAAKALSKAQNDFWVEDFQLRYAFDSDGSAASLTLKKYAGDAASVTIPDGVTIVGDSAFERNTSLTAVVLPDSVVTIGANAFRSCTGLTKAELSSKLEKIVNYAFDNCKALKEIQIPETVTEIGSSAFRYCAGLTELTLPDGLQTIGESAFEGCSGLARLVIPDGVQSVGSYAFHSTSAQLCCSMGSRAAEALSRVGYDFYTETWKLRYTFDSDKQVNGLRAERYLGSDAAVTLPEGTTLIGGSAFKDCAFITSVTLPEKLLSIGNYAFSGCTGLTEIVIPDSVTTIGSYAFSGCTGLTRVVLPAGLTAIPESCFNNCKRLPGIAIPETVTSIGSWAFCYCSELTAITLPQGLQTLGANVFLYCENLPYVDVPDTLESAGYCIASDTTQLRCSIGSSAAYALSKKNNSFYNNGYRLCYTYADRDGSVTGLVLFKYVGTEAEVRVPDGVTELLYFSFYNNSAVTSVVLPETVVKIGERAFSECKNLTSVTLPQGIVEIQDTAFWLSPKLTVIDIPDGLQKAAWLAEETVQLRCSFGSSAAFALSKGGNNFCAGDFQMRYLFDDEGNRNGLRLNKYLGTDAEVTVPEEVTETGSAFKDCKTVTKVVLPAGLTKLESNIFSGCTGLKEIAIPEGVTSIGNGAFRDCEALTELALPQGLKKIGGNAFIGCKSLTYIEIPDGVETVGDWIASESTQLRCSIGSSAAIALSKSDNGFCVDGLRLCYRFDDDGNTNGLTAKRYLGSETEVTVPDGVDSIGDSAFYGCNGLTKLALPQGLKEIGGNAFLGCEGLSYIDIPDGVEKVNGRIASESTQLRCSLGSSAAIALSKSDNGFCVDGLRLRYRFDDDGNTNGLTVKRYLGSETEVTVPDGVDSIGDSAFHRCTGLSNIVIPDSVVSIGDSAFYGCTGLTKLALPQGLKEIGDHAFVGCAGLSYIDIPDGLETAGNWIADDSVQLRCSIGSSAAIALSRSDNGFCVDGLRMRYRFDDDGNTNGLTVKRYLGSETEVTVPDGVDSIGDSAFYGCTGLTKLALPQGLKEIGVNAFLGCEGLSYIDISDGVETVGDWIASESIQLRCSIGSSAAIALSKAEQNFCVDDFAVRHSFTDGGAVNGLIAERYVGGKVGAVLTLPQGVTETSQYLLNEEPLENVMCLKLPEGFKKLTIDNLLWRSAVVFPESIQSIAIEEEWEGAPPVIFYCYRDTVAESFAQKRGITIVYLDGFKPAQTTVAMRSDYTLPIGSELRLSEIAAAVPSMPENCALNAVSSNPEVLQVESDGTIRVVGKGDATLRASLSRYPDIYAEACVWGYVQPTSATLAEEIWIPAKATRDLLKKDLIILPADSRAPIDYEMDNWDLFEQLEGEFTLMAVNRGDTALYVYVPGFDTLTAQIHVTARFSELAFEQAVITIPADTRATLCAQAVTTTHTYVNEYMTFESSAPDVATVDEDGVVYGVSEGSATITATSYNGLTAVCTVTVQGGNGSGLKLPAFLKEIGEEAFAGCSEESVIVPDGCETIGARAFADSANLRTITIPASVTSIAADAFDGCAGLTIRTPKGSYASRYAAAHGFGCVAE